MTVCFRLLLLMGVTLLGVTCIPAVDSWMMQGAGSDLSVWQETTGAYRRLDDNQGNVVDNRASVDYWREFTTKEDTDYQGLDAMVTAQKTKWQCRQEVMTEGYLKTSQECKDKLKVEKSLCQVQADFKGVVFSDLCKKLTYPEGCTEKRDCRYSAMKTCCWVPGNTLQKQCVLEVTRSYPLYMNTMQKKHYTRKSMLNSIAMTYKLLQYVYKYKIGIMVLPVGQGDCIAMKCPNENLVMFDCGSSNRQNALTAEEVKSVILDKVKRVTIFISHGDVDHYRHLPYIFSDSSKVDQVIIGGSPDEHAESDAIRQWMRTMANQGKLYGINGFSKCIGDCNGKLQKVQHQPLSNTWLISGGPTTNLDNMDICGSPHVHFDIIAANVGKKYKNQKSIVLKVTAGTWSVLLAGDMEGSAATAVAKTKSPILNMPDRLRSNVFQVSHHGAGTDANKIDWLQVIRPEEAFVSHAHMGQYGHPRCDAIERLLSVGSISTGTRFSDETHPFYCARGNNNNGYHLYPGETCHSIFSTYPTANAICVIFFEVAEFSNTKYNCYEVQ